MLKEQFVKRLGDRRRRGFGKARPGTPPRVGIERKLRNDEKTSTGVVQREVHFPLRIFEDPEYGTAFRKRTGRFGAVVSVNAEKDEEPGSDFTLNLSVDGDARFGNALYECPHANYLARTTRG